VSSSPPSRALLAFLLVAAAPIAAVAAERPSFDCAGAKTAREMAVCAIAELAHADRAMASAHAAALRRLSPRDAAALVADQRAFLRGIDDGFDFYLWGKAEVPDRAGRASVVARLAGSPDGEDAIALRDLHRQLEARTRDLAAITPVADDWPGAWIDNRSTLSIAPPVDGVYRVVFGSYTFGRIKYHCEFSGDFRAIGPALVAEEVENEEAGRSRTHIELHRDGVRLGATETTPDDAKDPDVHRACGRIPWPDGAIMLRIAPSRSTEGSRR